MDVTMITELIASLGFPIACVVALGFFVYRFYKDSTKASADNMAAMQSRCLEREEWLRKVLVEAQSNNAKLAEVITKHDVKLNEIQTDVKEIKEEMIILANK